MADAIQQLNDHTQMKSPFQEKSVKFRAFYFVLESVTYDPIE